MADMQEQGLLALGADELLIVCNFLGWRDIVNLSLACKSSYDVFRTQPWVWLAAYGKALPCSGRLPAPSKAREAFIRLFVEVLSPSEKVFKRQLKATIEGVLGGQQCAQQGVLAVPARSKLDYGHSTSPLLTWSQLLESRGGLQLEYRPAQSSSLAHQLSNTERADNVGVALVRRCFPFGRPGTALFGHPTLRYFEVTILPPPGGIEGAREGAGARVRHQGQLLQCGVSVGVVESRQALCMLRNGLHCGWYSGPWDGSMQSVGYHGQGGRLFPAPDDSRWEWAGQGDFAPPYGPGDTVGCGVDLARGLLFFTLNGQAVGMAAPGGGARQQELPECLAGCGPVRSVQPLALQQSQLAVCLQSSGDRVALNLGQDKFRFDLGGYLYLDRI